MKIYQPVKSIQDLMVGEMVMNVGSMSTYIIIHHHGSHAIAVRTVDISNPSEWMVFRETKKTNE